MAIIAAVVEAPYVIQTVNASGTYYGGEYRRIFSVSSQRGIMCLYCVLGSPFNLSFVPGILIDLLNHILAQASAQGSFGAGVTAAPTYFATQFYGRYGVIPL
jgi:hypothetical protein